LTNTLIVTGSTVVLTTACAVLAGYALVYLRLPGRALVVAIMVATLFLPARLVALIGIFEINWHLHLLNTLIGLILPYVALNCVVSILIMRGVFQQISPELVDAARIDGSGSWHTLWAVLLPLAKNGIVVVVITNFVFAWGEYLLAMTLNYDQSTRTKLVALVSGLGGHSVYGWPQVAAAYLLFMLPGIVAFAFLQRWFIKGLIEGALNA
jgi:ABC-type glycerol-3-phosphate transport system permease component